MQFIQTTIALAAIAAPVVRATGVAAVVNLCSYPVYLWSVGDEQSNMVTLPNETTGYQEPWRMKADASGISVKLATSYIDGGAIDMSKNVTQFEYTWTPSTSETWYDLSSVNGDAFENSGKAIQPSDPSCPVVNCAADDAVCKAAYNNPKDDWATHVCSDSADLFFVLCAPGVSSLPSRSIDARSADAPEAVIVNPDGTVSLSPVVEAPPPAAPPAASPSAAPVAALQAAGPAPAVAAPAAAPAPAPAASPATSPAISSFNLASVTSTSSFTMVDNWITYSEIAGRDAAPEAEAAPEAHAHAHAHLRKHLGRRNRIRSHSH